MSNARQMIAHGNSFPYDAPNEWWDAQEEIPAPSPTDWVHSAARGIIADLKDRRGIKNELYDIDESIRVDIVQSIAAIIREAAPSVPARTENSPASE